MTRIIILLYVLAASLGLIALKLGTKAGLPVSFVDNKIHTNINLYSMGGVLLYCISFVLYLYLISKNDLGYIIPLTTALVYVVIFTSSFFIFKEVFTVLKVTGIILILCGLILLNFKK